MNCEICLTVVPVRSYSGGACPTCRQGYEYEEGYHIVLTEKQLSVLRDVAGLAPKAYTLKRELR